MCYQDASKGSKSLLVVTGDHGMTDKGSHGGTTRHERDVPLVFLSPGIGGNMTKYDEICAISFVQSHKGKCIIDMLVHAHYFLLIFLSHLLLPPMFFSLCVRMCIVYHCAKILPMQNNTCRDGIGNKVQQTDLPTTLSLLLGIPIPRNSMGQAIQPLIQVRPDSMQYNPSYGIKETFSSHDSSVTALPQFLH